MDIDPWADFEKISDVMRGSQLAPSSVDDELVYGLSDDIDADAGIMPLSDLTDLQWRMRMGGFSSYGRDEYDNEWEGSPVYDEMYSPVTTKTITGDLPLGTADYVWFFKGLRPNPLISSVPSSQSSQWTGRQWVRNSDPTITNDTTYNWSGGAFYFDVTNWEEEAGVSSFQIMDAYFNFGLFYVSFDYDKTNPSHLFYASEITGGKLDSVHLIINGKDVGEIEAQTTGRQYQYYRSFSVSIPDTKITFEEQLVRSVSIAFYISPASLNSGMNDYSGGVGAWPGSVDSSHYPVVSSSTRLFSGVDNNSENTGLLRSILDFLGRIVTGITELPGKVANAIIDGLKSLFIPDEDFLVQWKEDFFTLLKERLGFIYQCFEILGNFFDNFIKGWGDSENYTFKFPTIEFTIEGTTYTVIQEQVVSLDNPVMDVLRPFAGTVVSIVTVLAFIHTMEDMFIAIISGWSYFSYLNRRNDSVGEEEQS